MSARVGLVRGMRPAALNSPSTMSADPPGVGVPVVLAVDQHDRHHDEVGEYEGDNPREADSAGPQDGGERDVADRAHEAEDGDDRPDDGVLDQLHARRGVREEERVEEAVWELADEPREQKPDRDLLPEHRPVVPEVLCDVRPGAGARQAPADRHMSARALMLMAAVCCHRVPTGLLLEAL